MAKQSEPTPPAPSSTELAETLPGGLTLLWGLAPRPRRGPRPGLSLERVVAAAIRIADADGLAAVSMSRVANDLGFTTMSLYRYVPTKDDLLMIMMDTAVGPPPPIDDSLVGWRPGLERWCRENLAFYRAHPWVFQIPIHGPPLMPSQLAWMDYGLHWLRGTALAPNEKLSTILMLTMYARSQAQLTYELKEGEREAGVSSEEELRAYGNALARLVDPERFPALHEAIFSGMFSGFDDDPDEDFEFGLERILDGIGQLVDRRAAQGLC